MRRHTVHFEAARGALALVLSLALVGLPGPARAQDPGFAPTQIAEATRPPGLVAAARPVLVDLRFAPERLLGDARLRLTPNQPGLTAASERPIVGPTMTLSLPPGSYSLEVVARRHEARTELIVTPGMRPVEVQLRRRSRANAPEFRGDSRLIHGLGGAAVIQLLTGAGLLIAGTVREDASIRRNEALLLDALVDAAEPEPQQPTGLALVESSYSTARYHRDLSRAMTLEVVGGAVMMAGVGAGIAALPVVNRSRVRAAYVEIGLGAAMAAGGATWLVFFERDRSTLRATTDPTERATMNDLRPLQRSALGGSLLTGLGVGLIVFPAITLLTNAVKSKRRDRTAKVTPFMAPGQAGLSLHGRF